MTLQYNQDHKRKFGTMSVGLGIVVSIIGGVAIGVATAMVYVNASIASAIAPVSAQSSANNTALIKQTALLEVIAVKDGIPQAEVNQLLGNGQ